MIKYAEEGRDRKKEEKKREMGAHVRERTALNSKAQENTDILYHVINLRPYVLNKVFSIFQFP